MSHSLTRGTMVLIAMGWLGGCAQRAGSPAPAPDASAKSIEGMPLSRISDEAYEVVQRTLALGDVGDFLAATETARAAVAADPDAVFAHLVLANFAANPQAFSAALTSARKREAEASPAEQLMIRAMYASFIANDTAAGLAAGTELVERYPESGRARLLLAGLQAAAADNEAARATVAELLRRTPGHLGAHNFLANSYLFNEPKDFHKAEQHMAKITELRPDAASAWVGLGDARRAMLKLDAARADYSKALTIQPGHSLAAVKRGHVNSFLGSFEAARADYDAGLETASTTNRPGLANFRAFVHLHAGQHERAIEELEALLNQVQSMEMSEGDKRAARILALQNISNIAFYANEPAIAESAVARMSETYAAQADSVDVVSARGQKAAAIYWRGKLAAHLGDFAAAEALAAEYLEVREPDRNPRKKENYHEILGIASLRQKDYDAAVGHLRQSNLQAGDILTRYHLAEALEGAGSVADARALFGEVADWNFNSVGYALLRNKARARAGGG